MSHTRISWLYGSVRRKYAHRGGRTPRGPEVPHLPATDWGARCRDPGPAGHSDRPVRGAPAGVHLRPTGQAGGRGHGLHSRTGAATGWSARTAGCSASATPSSTARSAGAPLGTHRRDRRHARRGRLLAGGRGRRGVQLRRRRLPRLGSAAHRLAAPVVGIAATPDGGGYWLVGRDGGVFSFGDAVFHGSPGGRRLAAPVVGMAATRDGGGYWLVACRRRGVQLRRRRLPRLGSPGSSSPLPIVGIAATPDGGGYWLVGSDGGVFSFGDAPVPRFARAARARQPR